MRQGETQEEIQDEHRKESQNSQEGNFEKTSRTQPRRRSYSDVTKPICLEVKGR